MVKMSGNIGFFIFSMKEKKGVFKISIPMLFFFSLRLKLLFEQFVFDMNNICEKFGLHASGAMTFDQSDVSPTGY
jgi:hypothetical protein